MLAYDYIKIHDKIWLFIEDKQKIIIS